MKFIVTERNYYEVEAKNKDSAIEIVQNNEGNFKCSSIGAKVMVQNKNERNKRHSKL